MEVINLESDEEEEDPEEDITELKEVIDLTDKEEDPPVHPQKTDHLLKEKDPGCLTISCILNDCDAGEAMIDSGASINMIPKHFLRKINGLILKPSDITITVADGSKSKPLGRVEDVVVRIEKLEFLADFIVMDIEDEGSIPVILGRPFMATSNMLISVHDKRIMMRDKEYSLLYTGHEKGEVRMIRSDKREETTSEEDIAGTNFIDNYNSLHEPAGKEKGVTNHKAKEDPIQPGIKVRYKRKEWIVKELKEKGEVEIEAPYSRHTKRIKKRRLCRWEDEDPRRKKKT